MKQHRGKLPIQVKSALFAVLLAGSAHAAGLRGGPLIDPPPGWSDADADGKIPKVLIALKGPETSSFIVKRAPAANLDNPASVRHYLNDVVEGLRRASGHDYKTNGRVETKTFRNGMTAQLVRAQEGGADRLVVAVFAVKGDAHLAVLTSAAPEAMMPSLIGALQIDRVEGAVQTSGVARSLDSQLEIALGGGLRARAGRRGGGEGLRARDPGLGIGDFIPEAVRGGRDQARRAGRDRGRAGGGVGGGRVECGGAGEISPDGGGARGRVLVGQVPHRRQDFGGLPAVELLGLSAVRERPRVGRTARRRVGRA